MDIVKIDRRRSYPPRVTGFTTPFWRGVEEGKLLTTRCTSCNKLTFPPKPFCPHCWIDEVIWVELKTTGTLYSWTRVHAAPEQFVNELPYTAGVVDLDDNLRMACRVEAEEGIEPVVGGRVKLKVLMYQDGPLLAAKPL